MKMNRFLVWHACWNINAVIPLSLPSDTGINPGHSGSLLRLQESS